MRVQRIAFDAVKPFVAAAKKESVSFENPIGAKWYGIYWDGHLIAFYCMVFKGRTARFKSNYTVPEYRGRGCLQKFIEHAKDLCRMHGIKELTAFCTPLSVKSHIRNGAVMQSQNKNIAFVKYKL